MRKIAVTALKTLLCMWLVTAIFIFLISYIYYNFKITDNKIMIGIAITYFAATFLGGFIFGKIMEHKKYLWGIGVALIYVLIICAIAFCISGGRFEFPITMVISCVLGGMLGGMLS